MNSNLINILILQSGWWITTLFYQKPHIYLTYSIFLISMHLFFCSKNKVRELSFIIIATTIGCLADALAIKLNLYKPNLINYIFPLWLVSYWLVFTTSFSMSLSWLKNKLILTSIMGLIFAPLTYFAGEKFKILIFNKELGLMAFISYGLIWAFIYPLQFKIFNKINPTN